jgi:hypothetical protein
MLASKSAMASESSPKAGSNALSGKAASSPAIRAESRNEDLDDGRSGVVGRGVRGRELDRLPVDSWKSLDMVSSNRNGSYAGSSLNFSLLECDGCFDK